VLDFTPDLAKIDFPLCQYVSSGATALLDQSEQDMNRTDILIAYAVGFLIGELERLSSSVRKQILHGGPRLIGPADIAWQYISAQNRLRPDPGELGASLACLLSRPAGAR
jgi:hypothetical protein